MSWWPSRRVRRLPPPPPPDEMLVTEDRLRRNVEDVLVVRDRQVRGAAVVFRGELTTEPARALDLLIARFRPFGYTPYLREEAGVVAVQALPMTETAARPATRPNVILFSMTCVTMLLAGLGYVGAPMFDLPIGVPFGTLGAIILMRSPARDRNSLFDVAAAGPLAGLAVAFPAIVVGLTWSSVVPIPPEGYSGFGDSLLTWGLAYLRFGHIPPGHMLFTHPIVDAAWAGLLVTALNLIPVGQLDGGRIVYALFGRRHRVVGRATVMGLIGLGVAAFFWTLREPGSDFVLAIGSSLNWFVWAGLISWLVGLHHSPPLDDVSPLSWGRRAIGVLCLILLVLMLPPFLLQIKAS